jgi:hypothetical protein
MQCDLEHPGALARLLRELPDDSSQPYGWSEFQRRAEQRAYGRHGRHGRAGGQALAALGVIALGVVVLSLRLGGPAQPAPRPQDSGAESGGVGAAAIGAGERSGVSAARAELLERWLASLPDEPAVARVGARAAMTGLEDRLAEVDDLLTAERIDQAQPTRLFALQLERQRLVSSLAQVRYAETLAAESR